MSPPEQPRKFFVDRSLGRVAVPGLLRAAGWDLITLAEHYGVPEDEQVSDTRWIEDSAKRGWVVLMKDKRIRYRQAEIEAVIEHHARCFVVTRGDLTSTAYADRFIANQDAIFSVSGTPGPFIYAVHTDRLERLYPRRDQ
ncbi:PIN-like domain-containing protein [Planomonospora parontospora]|uniref:PIN-like domain-containing protein n=1 Tax=Planomonospora parontospora TaxID=58119 RepID=UPI00166FBE41|nr:hypothetical protein [Planomonospora parontospora]GGL46365.1 putative ribonuclease VapC45 [Planomonospora parontospora subsp. antibiotica]GII16183.1 putative ribonuclease VapC45 [Planomonospora parontospora subsp. antibiotica]